MRKGAIAVLAVATLVACAWVDLSACGDKYTRIGRSARLKGYAAIHPASILVYRPANSAAKDAKDFEDLLKRAGHKPLFVQHGTSIAQAAAGAKYDLVIADYSDAATIRQQLQSIAARPDVLPILHKPSKALVAQAEQEYQCLITSPSMSKFDALDEIDHAMERRLKGSPPPSARK